MASFAGHQAQLRLKLMYAETTKVGHWQSIEVHDKPQSKTKELLNVSLSFKVPPTVEALSAHIKPNIEWADEHFAERVGGEPLNPPPSHVRWPYAVGGNAEHTDGTVFSHTYPERIWPKHANYDERASWQYKYDMRGLRFLYGDLDDLVGLIEKDPTTRQAYLPIWFPEDLYAANVEGQRVPCTLGYHFIMRNNKLHMTYYIRSCDFVRHFRDDVYLACRLLLWVLDELKKDEAHDVMWDSVTPGDFHMHCVSMHCFEADMPKLKRGDA